jgi:hypothetical protein
MCTNFQSFPFPYIWIISIYYLKQWFSNKFPLLITPTLSVIQCEFKNKDTWRKHFEFIFF